MRIRLCFGHSGCLYRMERTVTNDEYELMMHVWSSATANILDTAFKLGENHQDFDKYATM